MIESKGGCCYRRSRGMRSVGVGGRRATTSQPRSATRRDPDAACEVTERVRGDSAVAVRTDLVDAAQRGVLYDRADSPFGGVDIVTPSVEVAGPAPTAGATDEGFTEQAEVNVRGLFDVLRHAPPPGGDDGRVVTLSSSAPGSTRSGSSVPPATTGAVGGCARIVAEKSGSGGVTVRTVASGPVETEWLRTGKSATEVEGLAGLAARNRIPQPADVADAVCPPVSPDGGWISGQVIRVNGELL